MYSHSHGETRTRLIKKKSLDRYSSQEALTSLDTVTISYDLLIEALIWSHGLLFRGADVADVGDFVLNSAKIGTIGYRKTIFDACDISMSEEGRQLICESDEHGHRHSLIVTPTDSTSLRSMPAVFPLVVLSRSSRTDFKCEASRICLNRAAGVSRSLLSSKCTHRLSSRNATWSNLLWK
jgi:hypothetical protein